MGDCARGQVEIYSVRDGRSGKRLGCVGVRFHEAAPRVFDIKGYANTPPTGAVRQATRAIYRRLAAPRAAGGN